MAEYLQMRVFDFSPSHYNITKLIFIQYSKTRITNLNRLPCFVILNLIQDPWFLLDKILNQVQNDTRGFRDLDNK